MLSDNTITSLTTAFRRLEELLQAPSQALARHLLVQLVKDSVSVVESSALHHWAPIAVLFLAYYPPLTKGHEFDMIPDV